MYKEKATLVFDIETIPDINKAKQIYNLDNLTDEEAFEALKNMRRQETGGSDFFRHHLHKVICIFGGITHGRYRTCVVFRRRRCL